MSFATGRRGLDFMEAVIQHQRRGLSVGLRTASGGLVMEKGHNRPPYWAIIIGAIVLLGGALAVADESVKEAPLKWPVGTLVVQPVLSWLPVLSRF